MFHCVKYFMLIMYVVINFCIEKHAMWRIRVFVVIEYQPHGNWKCDKVILCYCEEIFNSFLISKQMKIGLYIYRIRNIRFPRLFNKFFIFILSAWYYFEQFNNRLPAQKCLNIFNIAFLHVPVVNITFRINRCDYTRFIYKLNI